MPVDTYVHFVIFMLVDVNLSYCSINTQDRAPRTVTASTHLITGK